MVDSYFAYTDEHWGLFCRQHTKGETKPVDAMEIADRIRKLRPGTGDVPCLIDLEPAHFQVVHDRPYTAVLQCCDAAHWEDFYSQVHSIVPGFRPHPMTTHGGALLLAPDDVRVNYLKLEPFRNEVIGKIATAVHVKQFQIARVFCASHYPCGIAQALGLNEVDVIDLTLQAKARIEATYMAYHGQLLKKHPEARADGRFEWALDIQVVPLLHVGRSDYEQKTYYIDDRTFCRGLAEGKVEITEDPVINEALFDDILECSSQSKELAIELIRRRREAAVESMAL